MQLIRNWLEGKQNFIVGKVLYTQFGNDQALKKLFAKGEQEPGARMALLQAMQALLEAPAPAADTQAAQDPEPLPGKTAPQKEDPVLKALQLQWKSKYKAMQYLRLQLEHYGKDNALESQAACLQLCTQILTLEQEVMSIWQKVDLYRSTGKLEEVKEIIMQVPEDPAELAKKISSVQRYIRRHKANAASQPNNPKYPALIARYEQQLTTLTTPKQTQDGAAKKATL